MHRHALRTALLALALASAGGPAAAASPSKAEVARQAAALLARNYRDDAPGAAVLVARGDTILFRGARGEADLGRHEKLRPDSVFRIASVTKQFAAAGLLKLVEAGKVRLDDPLSRFVPDFPGGDRIRIEQLLNHTAGVKNYTDLPGYMDEYGPARPDHRADDRRVQGLARRLRAGHELGLFEQQLRAGRSGDRGGERNAVARLARAKPVPAARNDPHRLRQRSEAGGAPGARLHDERRGFRSGAAAEHDPAARCRGPGLDRRRSAQMEPGASRRPGASKRRPTPG